MPDEMLLVRYADNVAALIAARTVKLAQFKLNNVMPMVNAKMEDYGLSLTLSKTQTVVLSKKRIQIIVPLRLGNETIESKPATKYLGIMVDTKLNFWEQVCRTAVNAARGVMSLIRLVENIRGPFLGRRRLFMSAVHSVLLYSAEVWANV